MVIIKACNKDCKCKAHSPTKVKKVTVSQS